VGKCEAVGLITGKSADVPRWVSITPLVDVTSKRTYFWLRRNLWALSEDRVNYLLFVVSEEVSLSRERKTSRARVSNWSTVLSCCAMYESFLDESRVQWGIRKRITR
jgi:hypothetical protein